MKGFGNIMKEAQKLQAADGAAAGGGRARRRSRPPRAAAWSRSRPTAGRRSLSIKIDREVINPEDAQMLEDLVLAACNEALRKSREMVQAEMSKLTAGLKIPGLGM